MIIRSGVRVYPIDNGYKLEILNDGKSSYEYAYRTLKDVF